MTDTNSQRNEDPKNVCSDGSLLHGTYETLHNPTQDILAQDNLSLTQHSLTCDNLTQDNPEQDDGEELIDDDFIYSYIDQYNLSDNVGDALCQNDFENIKKEDFPNYLKELTESGEAPFIPNACRTEIRKLFQTYWFNTITLLATNNFDSVTKIQEYLAVLLNFQESSNEIQEMLKIDADSSSPLQERLYYCALRLWGMVNVNRNVLDLLGITANNKGLIAPEKPITDSEFNKFLKKDILYYLNCFAIDRIIDSKIGISEDYKGVLKNKVEKNLKELEKTSHLEERQIIDLSQIEADSKNPQSSMSDSKDYLKNSNQSSSMNGSNSSVKSISI